MDFAKSEGTTNEEVVKDDNFQRLIKNERDIGHLAAKEICDFDKLGKEIIEMDKCKNVYKFSEIIYVLTSQDSEPTAKIATLKQALLKYNVPICVAVDLNGIWEHKHRAGSWNGMALYGYDETGFLLKNSWGGKEHLACLSHEKIDCLKSAVLGLA